MKLSESYARSIIDAVEMGARKREISKMLNDFLADKVKQTTKYEPELVQDCPENDEDDYAGCVEHAHGDYVKIQDLLTDN